MSIDVIDLGRSMTKAVRLNHSGSHVVHRDPVRPALSYWPTAASLSGTPVACGWLTERAVQTWRFCDYLAGADRPQALGGATGCGDEDILTWLLRRVRESPLDLDDELPGECVVLLPPGCTGTTARTVARSALLAGYRRGSLLAIEDVALLIAKGEGKAEALVLDIGASGLRAMHVTATRTPAVRTAQIEAGGFLAFRAAIRDGLEADESRVPEAVCPQLPLAELQALADQVAVAAWRSEVPARGIRFTCRARNGAAQRVTTRSMLDAVLASARNAVAQAAGRAIGEFGLDPRSLPTVYAIGAGAYLAHAIGPCRIPGGAAPETAACIAVVDALRRSAISTDPEMAGATNLYMSAGSKTAPLTSTSTFPATAGVDATRLLQPGARLVLRDSGATERTIWTVPADSHRDGSGLLAEITVEGCIAGCWLLSTKTSVNGIRRYGVVDPLDSSYVTRFDPKVLARCATVA